MIDKRVELVKMGALLRNPEVEARLKLLQYLLDADILDEAFSKHARAALISTVFFYFKCTEQTTLRMHEVISAPLPRPTKLIRELLINKLEHFIAYSKQVSAPDNPMPFAVYYGKSGLNRAITFAWEDKKKIPKGLVATLLQTKDKDPEECFYRQHMDLCLSLNPEQDFKVCLKALLHFLQEEVGEVKGDTYAFFLIKRLAAEFDFEAKNEQLKTRLAEWSAQKFAPGKIRDFFCSAVKDRYFYCSFNESGRSFHF